MLHLGHYNVCCELIVPSMPKHGGMNSSARSLRLPVLRTEIHRLQVCTSGGRSVRSAPSGGIHSAETRWAEDLIHSKRYIVRKDHVGSLFGVQGALSCLFRMRLENR